MADTKTLIEQARAAVAGHAPTEPEVLAYRLADALEAAEQRAENVERQVQIRAEDSIAARVARQNVRAVEEWVRVNQERDALAAVVEKVRDEATNTTYEQSEYAYGYDTAMDRIADILATAPADALREHDARVWDEGYGYALADVKREIRNPYREEKDA